MPELVAAFGTPHTPLFPLQVAREEPQIGNRPAVAEFPGLTGEERRALLAGGVGRLHELGAHSFLLGYLARHTLFGLTQAAYAECMRARPAC